MSLETMTKLASTTVGAGGTTSITFSNIPQGYTDLCVKFSGRISSNGEGYPVIRFNGDTGSNYSFFNVRGDGGSASTGNGTTTYINLYAMPGTLYTANIFGSTDVYVYNYSGNTYKSVNAESSTENNSGTSYNALVAGFWSNSSSITSLTLTTQGANETLSQFTTATLYGIKNARQTAGNSIKATGGNIVFDGTYVYHVFNSTGAFVPTQSLTADVLAVAGGGGGGAGSINYGGGGGGGAGGLLGFANQSFSSGITYACTVGAGGAGGASGANPGVVGSDSQVGALTTVKGGGYGGTYSGTTSGGTGGSGGGASQNGSGGAATSGQGNTGGTGTSSGSYWGGSGGGAGAAATNASGATSSTAGVGSSAYSAWGLATGQGQNVSGTYYFAGGGGGGNGLGASGAAGGYGGGGSGGQGSSSSVAGNPGTANTGGGGGGVTIQSAAAAGGAGGSGIVIIRYKG